MVRSMLSYSTLLIGLWMEALKNVIHILNWVPSKSVSKMPYELWTRRKPSLNYLWVWGCPTEAKIFNPNAAKLECKTVSCHFIGYLEKSKSFYFYCPDRHTKFVEMRHAVFLEDEMMMESIVPREISLEEKRVYVLTPMIHECWRFVCNSISAWICQCSTSPGVFSRYRIYIFQGKKDLYHV
jgi:hypothetical protein